MREAKGILSRLKWVLAAAVIVVSQVSPVMFASGTASAASVCVNDLQGANDEPGQKDLTKMCSDLANAVSGNITISFDWDDIAWSGNNSGDGCALFDTNNEGNANYSLCVVVKGKPATYNSTRLYSCNDANSDRCGGSTLISPFASVCSAAVSGTVANPADPFPAGHDFPKDTVANCTIQLADVGGAAITKLIDVCSYPSQQPNSDPSDCVTAAAKKGKLEVVKTLIPSSDLGKFNLSIDDTDFATNVGNNGTTQEQSISTGSHIVGETAFEGTSLVGYTTSITCKDGNGTGNTIATGTSSDPLNRTLSVDIADQSDVVCKITNTKLSGTIKVTKVVENPYGVAASASSFPLFVNGNSVTSGQTNTYNPEQYTVTETQQPGYTFKSFEGSCDANGVINLVANQDVTCTITNTAIQPRIKVIKHVVDAYNGGKVASNFLMKVTGADVTLTPGSTGLASQSFAGSETGTYVYMDAGSYVVSETELAGYTKSMSPECTGSVSVGDVDKVCTITNTAQAPSLNVTKNVINDNGGNKYAWDFKLYANKVLLNDPRKGGGDTSNSSVTYLHSNADDKEHTLAGQYTLSEDTVSGYSANNWSCTGNSVPLSGSTITIKLGETVNCEITNNDDAAGLKLVKALGTNLYGAIVNESDWKLTATGPTLTDSFSGNGTAIGTDLSTGTYALTETSTKWTDPKSFTASDWSCLAFGATTPTVIKSSIALALGDNYTCTITNTAVQPKLTVIKHVDNGNTGGTKTAGEFTMNVTGSTVSTPSFAGSEAPGKTVTLNVGTYGVDESFVSGYSKTLGTDCSGSVTLGDDKSCTITNTAIAPKLILKKTVVNDNGGTETADKWTLKAQNGSNPPVINTTGTLIANTSSLQAKTAETTVMANTAYTLSESGPTGYTSGSWSCDGGNLSNGAVTLALGTTVTCSITNNDNSAALNLVKALGANLYGATVSVNDWTLAANGPGTGAPNDFSGNGTASGTGLSAGNYTLSETSTKWTNPASFTNTGWSCQAVDQKVPVIVSSSIALALGDNYTCTITNSAVQPKLTVIKHVDNGNTGGTKTASNFTMYVEGKSVSKTWFPGNEAGTNVTLNVGGYSVTEGDQTGYTMDASADCTGTATLGYDKTCTITNTAIAPLLTLKKEVINNNSGKSKPSSWTLTATTKDDELKTISGNGEDGVDGVTAVANVVYTLSESGPSGYTAGNWYCYGEGGSLEGNKLTLSLAADVTCEITNDDVPHPSIKVVKSGPATANAGDTVTYTFTVTNTGDTPLGSITVADNIAGKGVYQSGDVNNDGILQVGETWIYTAQYTIPAGTKNQVNNTVKACGSELQIQPEFSDEIRVLRLNSDSIAQQTNETAPVCDDDMHTLSIPEVLVNTGTPLTLGWAIGSIMLFGAMYLALPKRQTTSARK